MQLGRYQDRKRNTNESGKDRKDEIHCPNVFVVRRIQIPPPTRRIGLMSGEGCGSCRHGPDSPQAYCLTQTLGTFEDEFSDNEVHHEAHTCYSDAADRCALTASHAQKPAGEVKWTTAKNLLVIGPLLRTNKYGPLDHGLQLRRLRATATASPQRRKD